MKHFEDLWNEAEEITHKDIPISNKELLVNEISQYLNLFKDTDNFEIKERLLGTIIFYIAALSKKEQINVYAALQLIVNLKIKENE